MLRHRPNQQDFFSRLFAGNIIDVGQGTNARVSIDRLEVHLGLPSGARLELGHVHALSGVRRRDPGFLLPQDPLRFVNRSAELETLRQAMLARQVVDLYGVDGAGKSALAARLVHEIDLNHFPDGVVFVTGRFQGPDLLQALFDVFYESDVPVKIRPEQTPTYLQGLRIMVVLDDLRLGPQQIDPILDALEGAAVLITGPERTALGRGRALPLKGLPREDAVSLFASALPGTLSAEEAQVVEQICALLHDAPLPIRCIAAQASQSERPLAKLLNELQTRKPWAGQGADLAVGPALEQMVLQLDEVSRKLLTSIGAFAGPNVSSLSLNRLLGLSENEFRARLEGLEQMGLLQVIPSAAGSTQWVAVAPAFHPTIESWLVEDSHRLEIADYYAGRLSRGEQLDSAELLNLLGAIEECARVGWLDHLTPLVYAADRALAELRWWATWQHVLDLTRRAAQTNGDRSLEVWAMHQMGTVLGALGVFDRALHLLRTAHHMRQAQGDQTGAGVTAHNMELLERLAPPPAEEIVSGERAAETPDAQAEGAGSTEASEAPGERSPSEMRRGRRWITRLGLLAALVVVLIGGTLALGLVSGLGRNGIDHSGIRVSWEFGDAWNTLDNQSWTQQIVILVEEGGAQGEYDYFVDDKPSEQTFEIVLPLCQGAQGVIRVEAKSGESGEVTYAFDSPFCR